MKSFLSLLRQKASLSSFMTRPLQQRFCQYKKSNYWKHIIIYEQLLST